MKSVAIENQLLFNKDVKLLTVGQVDQFYTYVRNNENMTLYGVVWCTSEWTISENASIPCRYSHEYEN